MRNSGPHQAQKIRKLFGSYHRCENEHDNLTGWFGFIPADRSAELVRKSLEGDAKKSV